MKGGKGGGAEPFAVMKLLAPEALAAAVIGKGGAVVAEMRQSTGARITLTDKDRFFPQTHCRVLTAQAAAEEALNEVAAKIVGLMSELVASGSPIEALGSGGELRLRLLVPRAAVGGIIGQGGGAIAQLREASGARVSIGESLGPGPGADSIVSVSGPAKGLEAVLAEVNRQVALLSGEAFFAAWAAPPTGAPSSAITGVAPTGPGFGASLGSPPGIMMPALGAGLMGGGAQGSGMLHLSPGVGTLMHVAQSLPPSVLEDSRGFTLSCAVPSKLVGGLIGRGGAGTKEVQMLTSTRVSIQDIPGDAEQNTLSITGPLPNTCAAYMLMMKRYLDVEQNPSGR